MPNFSFSRWILSLVGMLLMVFVLGCQQVEFDSPTEKASAADSFGDESGQEADVCICPPSNEDEDDDMDEDDGDEESSHGHDDGKKCNKRQHKLGDYWDDILDKIRERRRRHRDETLCVDENEDGYDDEFDMTCEEYEDQFRDENGDPCVCDNDGSGDEGGEGPGEGGEGPSDIY